jgi:hypothetical protein
MGELTPYAKRLIDILKNREHHIGCEIGVHTGETTVALLENLPLIKEYHAVDPWESYEKYDGDKYRKPGHKKLKTWTAVMKHFIKETSLFSDKVYIHKMSSVDAVKKFENEYFDWVFIDANHEYPYIKENIELWKKKVKNGGIISGHDYGNKKWPDIKKAVDEFFYKDSLYTDLNSYVWWSIK